MPQSERLGIGKIEDIVISPTLTIRSLPAEHFDFVFDRNQGLFAEQIKGVDGVIEEYFPQELHKMDSNPLAQTTSYQELDLPFYTKVTDLIGQNQKDVYILDPAHDTNFAAIEIDRAVGLLGLGFIGAKSTIDMVRNFHFRLSEMRRQEEEDQKLLSIPKRQREVSSQKIEISRIKRWKDELERRNLVSRRTLLTTAAQMGALMGAVFLAEGIYESTTNQPLDVPFEQQFRRIQIARGIIRLGESLNKPQSLLLMYPLVHWSGIKKLLVDRDHLKNEAFLSQKLINLLPENMRNSFNGIRHYQPQLPYQGKWSLLETIYL